MNKAYTFKFYNRYSITLQDSDRIGRKALHDKAKNIVDTTFHITDGAKDIEALGAAFKSLTWGDLDNKSKLIEKLDPIFRDELKGSDSETSVKNLNGYIDRYIPGIELKIDDIYDPLQTEEIRNKLKETNTRYDEFVDLIEHSKVLSAFNHIKSQIQSYSKANAVEGEEVSPTDMTSLNNFIKRLSRKNPDVAEKFEDSIKDDLVVLENDVEKENQALQELVDNDLKEIGRQAKYKINILNPSSLQTGEAYLNHVSQFNLKIEKVKAPYQIQMMKDRVNNAFNDFIKVRSLTNQYREDYRSAAYKTFKTYAAYSTLLNLSAEHRHGLTIAEMTNAAIDFIESLPIDYNEFKQLRTKLEENIEENKESLQHMKNYSETYTALTNTPGSKYYKQYPDKEMAQQIWQDVTDILTGKLLPDIDAKYDEEFIKKNGLKGINDFSQANLNKLKDQINKDEDDFVKAQTIYAEQYKVYLEALKKFEDVADSAANYNIVMGSAKLIPEGRLYVESLLEVARNSSKDLQNQYESAMKSVETTRVQMDNPLTKGIFEAYYAFKDTLDKIKQVCANEPASQAIKTLPNYIPKNNEFFNDTIIPQIQALIPTKEEILREFPEYAESADDSNEVKEEKKSKLEAKLREVDRERAAQIPGLLNECFAPYVNGPLFDDAGVVYNALNEPNLEGSEFDKLDDLYAALEKPIDDETIKAVRESIIEETGETDPKKLAKLKVTDKDVLIYRAEQWFKDVFGEENEQVLGNRYIYTLIDEILPKTIKNGQMLGIDAFKSVVNKFLAENTSGKKESQSYHKKAYTDLKQAYLNKRDKIVDIVRETNTKLGEDYKTITDKKEQKQLFDTTVDTLTQKIESLLRDAPVYRRTAKNIETSLPGDAKLHQRISAMRKAADNEETQHLTTMQAKWLQETMRTLNAAIKQENSLSAAIPILEDFFGKDNKDDGHINYITDIEDRIGSYDQRHNDSYRETVRNISSGLEDFLTSDAGKEMIEKYQSESGMVGEDADAFIKALKQRDVLADKDCTDPGFLAASIKFETCVRDIVRGKNSQSNADKTKEHSPWKNLWSYIVNYILKANDLAAPSKRRNYDGKSPRYIPGHNILGNPDTFDAHASLLTSDPSKVITKNSTSFKETAKHLKKPTTGDEAIKYCLACGQPLNHRKDSDLYQCPKCLIIYSKSMLK